MENLLRSSTGQGIKLRIKAFAALIIPVLNEVLKSYGVTLLSEDIENLVDACFIVIFACAELYGWIRAKYLT